MKSRSMAPTILLCTVSCVVITILGITLDWPRWLWILTPTLAAGILLLTVIGSGRTPKSDPSEFMSKTDAWPTEPSILTPESPAEPPFQETRVENVSLPSSMTGYKFLFSATVWWRPQQSGSRPFHADLAGQASEWVLSRARAVTAHEDPGHVDLAEHRLNGALGAAMPNGAGSVTALAAHVTLTLHETDREQLEKLAELRKLEDIWEKQRHYERSKREYIGGDVLKSPGSAVVWWLARHDDEIAQAMDMIGPLAQLSAAANDMEVPEPFRHLVSQAFADYSEELPEYESAEPIEEPRFFMPDPEPETTEPDDVIDHIVSLLKDLGFTEGSADWKVYVHRIANSTEASGHPEAAARIRRDLLAQPSPDEEQPADPAPPVADDASRTTYADETESAWNTHPMTAEPDPDPKPDPDSGLDGGITDS